MKLFDLIIKIDILIGLNNRLQMKFEGNKYYTFSQQETVMYYGFNEALRETGLVYESIQDEESLCIALSKYTDNQLINEFQRYHDFQLAYKEFLILLLKKQKLRLIQSK